MTKRRKPLQVDEPLRHRDHSKPRNRRDFLRQGFITGTGSVLSGGVFSLFTNPRDVYAGVSADLDALRTDMNISPDVDCNFGLSGANKVPFICFDLGGGANLAGSGALVGQGGQRDLLSESGYSKLGIPTGMIPGTDSSAALTPPTGPTSSLSGAITANILNSSTNNDFINDELGLLFHQDSPMLFGILERFKSRATAGSTEGAVIPARSDNDTGNNPHNPMYGIAKTGAGGKVVTLVGSQNSESGGRSMAPAELIDPKIRPTKVDRPSDVTGMVDVGDLTAVLSDPADVTAVMESMARITHKKLKLSSVSPNIEPTKDEVVKDLIRCGYLKAADLADRFAGVEVSPDDRNAVDPADRIIVNDAGGIFTEAEFDGSSEFRKTASVMKMVIDGNAGAGSISMGGYDYHTGERQTGENRDLRAGRCIGACLEYAAKTGKPLMVYVFSDGSLSSNGALDGTPPTGNNQLGGRNKGEWTGDNSSTACSFYLVFKPNAVGGGVIQTFDLNTLTDPRQIGRFSRDASVVTSSSPAANNVNLLVRTVMLNYMAVNNGYAEEFASGNYSSFANLFPNGNHGLGTLNNLISFGKISG